MARMLIDPLAGDYDPDEDEDAPAVTELVRAKVEGGEVRAAAAEEEDSGEDLDLLAALSRSVERAKSARGGGAGPEEGRLRASAAHGCSRGPGVAGCALPTSPGALSIVVHTRPPGRATHTEGP